MVELTSSAEVSSSAVAVSSVSTRVGLIKEFSVGADQNPMPIYGSIVTENPVEAITGSVWYKGTELPSSTIALNLSKIRSLSVYLNPLSVEQRKSISLTTLGAQLKFDDIAPETACMGTYSFIITFSGANDWSVSDTTDFPWGYKKGCP
jgi:hypothetical protein